MAEVMGYNKEPDESDWGVAGGNVGFNPPVMQTNPVESGQASASSLMSVERYSVGECQIEHMLQKV